MQVYYHKTVLNTIVLNIALHLHIMQFDDFFFFVFLFGQMLGCRNRGFSFTRALLGISADELHLCGDAAAIPLIQKMLKVTSDQVEVIRYLCNGTWSSCVCF